MKRLHIVLMSFLLASVAACGAGGGSVPVGQVVATVGGEEITASDLRAEMGGAVAPTPEAQRDLESSALRSIVNRHLLVGVARDQKLDKSPIYAIQRKRAENLTLIGLLEAKLQAGVPTPSREEADRFVAEHPDTFGQRKIFVVDQVVAPSVPQAVVRAMRPFKTLGEIEALLDQNKVPHWRAVGAIDGLSGDPASITQIAVMPSDDVFVVPSGTGVLVNQVRETRIVPVEGAVAINQAIAMLKTKRTQELVNRQIEQLISARANTVRYNVDYKPKPATNVPAEGAPK